MPSEENESAEAPAEGPQKEFDERTIAGFKFGSVTTDGGIVISSSSSNP